MILPTRCPGSILPLMTTTKTMIPSSIAAHPIPLCFYGLCAMTTWWSDQRSTWSKPTMASAVPALAGEMMLEMMLQGVMRESCCSIRFILKEIRWGNWIVRKIPNPEIIKLKIPNKLKSWDFSKKYWQSWDNWIHRVSCWSIRKGLKGNSVRKTHCWNNP